MTVRPFSVPPLGASDFFSAAIRSTTLVRSGSAGSLTSIPSPLSFASIIARSRVS